MKVEELTKEIYEKYPNVFDKIINYIGSYNYLIDDIAFNILYALLEEFFEEKGVDIEINKIFRSNYKQQGKYFIYIITYLNETHILDDKKALKIKQEAKQQAILKACEMLGCQS